MRIVAKFGGTSLGNGERIKKAARSVAKAAEEGHEVIVVASAMGSTTDELLDNIEFETSEKEEDEIVSMGERTSVRMLKAALTDQGVEAEFIEPGKDLWPVKVDEQNNIDLESTEKNADELSRTLEEQVPVITGFLAEGPDGEIRTLARGGSDTTAVLLGNCLDADKTVIVTDVEGVLTGNPNIVESTHNVGEISVDELGELSFRGAEVVAPEALTYKEGSLDVEVVHFRHESILEEGTHIEGEFRNLVDTTDREICCLTVAGREIRRENGVLSNISSVLAEANINIDGVSSGIDNLSFYIDKEDAEKANKIIHQQVLESERLSSVTLDEELAAVRIVIGSMHDRPGVINEIVQPLAEENINIHELTTSATSITVFVKYEEREKALKAVQRGLDV